MTPFHDPQPRILHVMTRYLDGGSERRLRDMVSSLPEAEHHLLVGEVNEARASRELPGVVRHPAPLRRSVNPLQDVPAFRLILSTAREVSPHLIVTHQSKAGTLGRLAASRLGVPAVHSLSMATFGPGYPWFVGMVFRAIERRMVSRTAAYAVVGDDLAAEYRALGAEPGQLHVIRSSASLPATPESPEAASQRLRTLAGFADQRPLIAYVGSLEPRKNVLSVVELLAAVRQRMENGSRPGLVVAGAGPQYEEILAHARGLGVENDVALLGYLDDPAPVFQGASVVVLLSRSEGLPQVLVQAAAAAAPFVSFDVHGVHELVAGGAVGTAIPWGDLDAAADAVISHITQSRPTTSSLDLSSWSVETTRQRYQSLFASVAPALDSSQAAT